LILKDEDHVDFRGIGLLPKIGGKIGGEITIVPPGVGPEGRGS
jgi:hypothetical protein